MFKALFVHIALSVMFVRIASSHIVQRVFVLLSLSVILISIDHCCQVSFSTGYGSRTQVAIEYRQIETSNYPT